MCAQGLLKGFFYTANVCDWSLCLGEYLYVLVEGVRGLGVYLALRSLGCLVCVYQASSGGGSSYCLGASLMLSGESCVPEGEPSLSGA